MRYQIISEGATLVHEVDRAGRAALTTALHKYMNDIWADFSPNGYDEENPDAQHNDYERMYQYYSKEHNRKELVWQVCKISGDVLSKVIQEDLQKRFGPIVIWKFGEGQEYKLKTSQINVQITIQPTEGRDAGKGGYFMPSLDNSYIKVHCDEEKLFYSAMGYVQAEVFGDADDRDGLVNSIAPTFSHEYSHLLQYFAAKGYKAFHSGITSVGGGRSGAKAPRQGGTGRIHWWRYIGSNAEIDSFASSAASQMIAAKESRRYQSGTLDREDIDYSLQDIASGYASDEWYNMYIQKYQEALAGEYADIGLSKEEASKVWKRFLKTLYAKLNAYKKATHGKEKSGWHTSKADPQWIEWAKKGLPFCASRLADVVAFECADQSYKNYEGNWSIQPDAPYQKAITFLQAYFFDEYQDFDKSMKIVYAFKNLVGQRLPHYQRQEAA